MIRSRRRAAATGRPHGLAATALGTVLVAACSLQPLYERPEPPIASTYPTGPAYAPDYDGTTLPADEIGWRDFLTDARLQRLVEIALANNRDLRIASLNVAQVKAQYRIERSGLLPQVSAGASMAAQRTPSAITQRNVTTRDYSVAASASWELDFFGRLQSLDEQALQQYFATAQARKAAQIALVAQVASQYLAILADDELLAVTRQTLEAAQASYQLTLLQFEAGTGTEQALRQSQIVVEQTNANLAAQVRARAQDENLLVLLMAGPLPVDLPPPTPLQAQSLLADIPAGLPSDLLARRPDIIAAEANLRGANASIGAARAAFFPSITLTGSFGVESLALGALFRGASLAWSFIPSITTPIFQGGRLEGSLDVAMVQKDINVAQYEKAVQTAFQEVANDLAARGTFDDEVAALERDVIASQRFLDLAQRRFQAGIDSYLAVLTAQTTLYAARQALVTARLGRLTTLVSLYKDLGGGWIERTGDTPAPPEDIGVLAPPKS
jgi:multidrug efflux system outer membrane protein